MRTTLTLLLLAACGGGKSTTVDAPVQADAHVADTNVVDAPPDPRGPRTIELAGPANGLLWDGASSTLFLTNGDTNQLMKFTDADGAAMVSQFPATTGGASLGDMVKRSDGSILTANFGFGMGGSLFSTTGGTTTQLTGLATNRRRIGLSQDSAGLLYDTYFISAGMGMQNGFVAQVTLDGGGGATEADIGSGFKKVVGLVATPDAVFVSDQTQKTIFKIAIPGNAVTTVTDQLVSADLLIMMPNGDLLTGGATDVYRVTQAGTITSIFTGFEQVHGLAYDSTLKRLFIVEHSATPGTKDKLHIRPLDN